MTTMQLPDVPIKNASDHPRFANGDSGPSEPPPKKIDTEAAKERVSASRNATKVSDKAPTARGRKTAERTPPAPIQYSRGMFKAPITALYAQGGNLLQYVSYPIGVAAVQQAEVCGAAWDEVAATNPTVRRWLNGMTKTGSWGKLFAAHIPIFMATMMVFGPESFRERMGATVADSMQQMAQSNETYQDPN
jgi:hypothetical protein